MHELQKVGLERAIAFLESVKCKYKLIDSDGNVHTNITEEEGRKRRPRTYKHGELSAHIRKHIEGIKIGQVATIPPDKFDLNSIVATATAIMSHTYGNGSYVSHKAENCIEILRTH
jgi:hypothetical protein